MKKLLVSLLVLLAGLTTAYTQTTKGSFAIGLHNFNPGGLRIDGVPANLFPQNSGLGFSFSTQRTRNEGSFMDIKEKKSTYGFSLSSHYFIWNNFSVGLTGNFYSGSTVYEEPEVPSEKYSSTLLMGGFVLKYYVPAGRNLKFWLKGNPAIGSIESSYNGTPLHAPKRLYQFTGSTGVAFFPNPNVAIDLGANFNVFTVRNWGNYNENSRKEYTDSMGMDVGFTVYF